NIYTVRQILEKGYSPAALRAFLISGHYRQLLNFTFEALDNASKTLNGIYAFLERLGETKNRQASGDSVEFRKSITAHRRAFFKALDDDINTPAALAEMHAIINETNARNEAGKLTAGEARLVARAMLSFDKILGLRFEEHIGAKRVLENEVQKLVDERERARAAKDFSKADAIRSLLKEKYHVKLEDTENGVRWYTDQ
ncbi:MAG: DALR domain-containing protein, partial [Candidatus Micrarchaeaceae archaeon]